MPGNKGRTPIPDAYQGREQAYVKHELLKAYLEKLFLIVGMSSGRLGITEICYVDCFAGPWSAENESLSDTSIGVSLRILDKCHKELKSRGVKLKFRALYVEKDGSAYSRLERFLSTSTPTEIDAKPLHGDFVAIRDAILSWCRTNSFAFFFIDPTGWKEIAVPVLKPLLLRRQSEFLINFMYDFVARTVSMAEWQQEMATLLGEPIEIGDRHGPDREKFLLSTYRGNLKRNATLGSRLFPRSAHVRVLDRKKERPKYHLVYLTSHPRGIIEFMQISEDLDLIQKRVRASTRQSERVRKSGQEELFHAGDFVDPVAGHADASVVERYWLEYLSGGEKRVGEGEFADLLENTDWFPGDFQKALGSLINSGKVRNLDAPRKRPRKPLHWEKGGERLVLVEK
jgi:three-Cys-motif partner protein